MRADGYATYNFAAVIDDALMGITHVLRGDDHVSNTPFQLLLYDALEFSRPKFGHLPMILGEDRKRLSKRHGATSVEEFADQGILPAAMVNYLALLGWSIGAGGDEVLTPAQLTKKFSLKKVNSAPAAFDYDKLHFINTERIKRLTPAERVDLAWPLVTGNGWEVAAEWRVPGGDDNRQYLDRILRTLGNRFSDIGSLPDMIGFFFHEEYPVDEEAKAAQLAGAESQQYVAALAEAVAAADDGSGPLPASRYEELIRTSAESLGIKAGQLIHPCRVALTGQERSAGIFEVMELIGPPRVVTRLRRALSE